MDKKDINCLDIISKYVDLVKRGKNYFGCCPLHDENTASFVVNPEKNFWKCYGCGKSGDAISFIMEYKNLSFKDALEFIENETGVVLNDKPVKTKKVPDEIKVLEVAKQFYNKNLLKSMSATPALKYLEERGINEKIIEENSIGFVSHGMGPNTLALFKELKLDNIKHDLINDKGNSYFENRIVFPIEDENGTIGFVGRSIDSNSDTKYLNSRESEIFQRNKLLFNVKNAKKNLSDNKQLIIVEGIFDCLALQKIGKKNVVATLGTSVSYGQALKINNIADEIVIFFDGDKSGFKGTIRLYEKIKGINPEANIKVVLNETTKDPDELVKNNEIKKIKLGNIFDYIMGSSYINDDLKEEYVFKFLSYETFSSVKKELKRLGDYFNLTYQLVLDKYEKHQMLQFQQQKNLCLQSIVKGFENKNTFIRFSKIIVKELFPAKMISLFKKFALYYKTNNLFVMENFLPLLNEEEKKFIISISNFTNHNFINIKKALATYYSIVIKKI